MTQKEIDEWERIHTELCKGDKYMLECMQSHLDYLKSTVEEDKI